MKILVAISQTPETTARIAFKNEGTIFDTNGVNFIMNPYDEWYALVRAIELKEKDPSAVLHLVMIGLPDCDAVIRKALALGGDEAIRINTDPADSYFVAAQIAAIAKDAGYDLILTGKETIDFNGASVGGMVAGLLNLPFISLTAKLDLTGDTATMVREIEGGEETVEGKLPLVVGCQKGMAEQRIPNMKGIMGARSKPLKVIEPVVTETFTELISFELPPVKKGVKMIAAENAEELITLLHEEAKVF